MTDKTKIQLTAERVVVPFARFARAKLPVAKLSLVPGFLADDTAGAVPGVSGIDLSGKPKVWFMIGRGRVGKTHLARWVCEMAEARGGQFLVAALDPINRSLAGFRNNVEEPDSSDPERVKDWLGELLRHAADHSHSLVIDMGGGDTSLAALLRDTPDLASVLKASGIEPIAVHLAGADQTDLLPLALTEALGFQPQATLIVLNEALARREKFTAVLEHPLMEQVGKRGAIQLWMPLLNRDTAELIDAHRWQFEDAKKPAIGGAFTASAVHNWLRLMDQAFAPVLSWLPS